MSKKNKLPRASIVGGLQLRKVHLTKAEVVDADDHGGPNRALLYAAHEWMDVNLGSDRHTPDLCDDFSIDAEIYEVGDGTNCLIAVDGLMDGWLFTATMPDESDLLPVLPAAEEH